MSKNKKIIISVAMVLLLAATAYLNVALTNASGDDKGAVTAGNFFTEYKSERTSTRQQEMLYLESVISNKQLSKETVDEAAKQKLALVGLMEKELVVEGLIKAKGFDQVAVTMSTSNENINVVVKAKELSQEDVAKIYNVLSTEMKAQYNNIKILPIE
ncbi:MAG: SpoIIIAH-like family protein [Clostridia bacterium]